MSSTGGDRVRVGPAGAQTTRRRAARTTQTATGTRAQQSIASFYNEESSGFKIPPFVVLLMSAGYIVLVALLHIIGKIRGAAGKVDAEA